MNSLDNLNLQPRIRNELEAAQITTMKLLLEASNDELLKANLTLADIQHVKLQAAKTFNLNIVCALDIRGKNTLQRLSVGCGKLDSFLAGGIAVGGITEIAGESSSGKTQLCLQLALMVQFPVAKGGSEGGAVYICSEGMFPSVRLQQLSNTFIPSQADGCLQSYKTGNVKFGDNIFINHVADAKSLIHCVTVGLPELIEQNKTVKVVILDSIAGVFRSNYDSNSMANRARDLQRVGTQLHKLSQLFNIAVVCVNQVTDVPSRELEGKHQSVAALGLAWANLVTTRIQLSRGSRQNRTMQVIFSPHLPTESCHFQVTEKGVAAVP